MPGSGPDPGGDSSSIEPAIQPATAEADRRIHRTVRWLQRTAWGVAAAIALLLPAAQWVQQARLLEAALQIETAQLASSLSLHASREPDTWLYRLNALQAELNAVVQRGATSAVRVLNERGQELVVAGTWKTTLVHQTHTNVLDSGMRVATIDLQADLRPAVVEALKGGLAGLLLAALVWWSIARLALGGLRTAIRELQTTRDEAQSANRAKGAFLAAMSHEIRTPMNGVLGMAELLSHSPLNEEQSRTVGTVRESAQSLLRIIDDILDFSKIEAGRLELESEALLLTPLVEGACDALGPVAAARAVQLWASVEHGVPERVLGDALRLRQVINNLVGNAIKFSAGRRERAGEVELRLSAAAGGVQLVVRDNGIGMDAATVARLFRPFTQAETSTTRRYGGTGLGLAITRRLVHLMNGRIEVTSAPGVGSAFTVWLPLVAHGEQPPARTDELADVQVLLVAECGLPTADISGWLERAGARVQTLADTGAALARARALPPPVVIVRDAASAEPPPVDDPLGDIRQLLLGRGRRGPARLMSPTVAGLDQLRRMPLLRAVAMLAGRASPDTASAVLDGVVHGARIVPTVAQAREQGRLILVAEDDAINRLVVTRQLALLGYAAEVAENGVDALRMWRGGDYALLLTDLHMPELDGYGLAQAVRADEAANGRLRQPILALTANALQGEAARARAAGIDDYLTKPAPLKLLRAALQHWLPLEGGDADVDPRADVGPAVVPVGNEPVLDLRVLRDLVGEDEALIDELRQDFIDQCDRDGAALMQAVRAADRQRVQAIAHRLKSAARAAGALALGTLCERLEQAPARRPDRAAQAQAEALASLLQQTRAELHAAAPTTERAPAP